jgi:membrane-associated HD superfamily phosphohydrolase
MLTKKRIIFLIALICCIELAIYLWAVWTSTFNENNFFAIESEFVFDKCARLAGRISSALILITLLMVGYYGLRKIYSDEKKKESFLILITLFTCNHLIHLLFVILRFRRHGELISLEGPINIGGTMHGFITFSFIIIIPFILWNYKHLNKLLYFVIILHLLNISSFIIKTFLGKVKPPDHPAYHNQFGIAIISVVCIYILYRVYLENKRNAPENNEN